MGGAINGGEEEVEGVEKQKKKKKKKKKKGGRIEYLFDKIKILFYFINFNYYFNFGGNC